MRKEELIELFERCDCEYNLESMIKKYYPNGELSYCMGDMGDAYIFISDDDLAFNLLEDLKD